jgi:predicted nucleic acid-binding protein
VTTIFADTLYWIALINNRDQWHERAVSLKTALTDAKLLTTDAVLMEVANFFAEYGEIMRRKVALAIHTILDDQQVEVFSGSRQAFIDGLTLYESRSDKGYSLTDCISMNVMLKRAISDVLSHDSHFTQEGFRILL